MEKLINVTNTVNNISIVFAQNYIQIAHVYLTDNDQHHHLMNPENAEQNIVLSSVLNQEYCEEGGWKVNSLIVIYLCRFFSNHGYFLNMGTK